MKKTVVALTTTLAIAAGPLAFGGVAEAKAAKADSCITKAEYKKIKKGMTLKQVASIVGSKGTVYSKTDATQGFFVVTRTFKACKPYSKKKSGIAVAFDNMNEDMTKGKYRVEGKNAVWVR